MTIAPTNNVQPPKPSPTPPQGNSATPPKPPQPKDSPKPNSKLAEALRMYKKLDLNGDGIITRADQRLAGKGSLASSLIGRALLHADKNHDGKVTRAEYLKYTQAKKSIKAKPSAPSAPSPSRKVV